MNPNPRVPTIVAHVAAVLVGAFVLTSVLLATLPQFRFESQFPALFPFFVWAAATGVGHLANLGRALFAPWRDAFGFFSLVPYLLVLLVTAVAPHLRVPWWWGVLAAAAAMVPFVVLGRRAATGFAFDPLRDADDASSRGTFTIGVALMLLAWSVSGPSFSGAVIAVLVTVGLAVASMMTHGLARASRTWGLRHWAALALGSIVVWTSVILKGVTRIFDQPGWVLAAVLAAGLPLIVANARDGRRR